MYKQTLKHDVSKQRALLKTLLVSVALVYSTGILSGCAHTPKKSSVHDLLHNDTQQRSGSDSINLDKDLIEQLQDPKNENIIKNLISEEIITFKILNEEPEEREEIVNLKAMLVKPDDQKKHPALLIVPSSGKISRFGKRWFKSPNLEQSDFEEQEKLKQIAVHKAYAQLFSAQGFISLSWDKRSCSSKDDVDCGDYPQQDIQALGPIAYNQDLDAACLFIESEESFNGTLIILAHGQATQTALSSKCIQKAKALILISPLPDAVDKVMVSAIFEKAKKAKQQAKKFDQNSRRHKNQETNKETSQKLWQHAQKLKNTAGSLEATFTAIKKNRFPKDAAVLGANPHYWQEWIKLSSKYPQKKAIGLPLLIIRGETDLQYSKKYRDKIDQLVQKHPQSELIILKKSDHYLMPLDQEKFVRILEALDLILSSQKQPSS